MKKFLVARYDVSELSEQELEGLAGEAHAQAEGSEFHPAVCVEVSMEGETLEEALSAEEQLALDLEAFKGKWVCVVDHKVAASADTLWRLMHAAREGGLDPQTSGEVWQVPSYDMGAWLAAQLGRDSC